MSRNPQNAGVLIAGRGRRRVECITMEEACRRRDAAAKAKAKRTWRVLVPHRAGCDAVAMVQRGTWPSPWYVTGCHVLRDRVGRKAPTSGRRWYEIGCVCGNSGCPARAIVSEAAIVALVGGAP